MIEILLLNVYQSIAWTAITFIACMIYKRVGHTIGIRQGRQDMISIFEHYEYDATQRLFNTLKKNREKNAEVN